MDQSQQVGFLQHNGAGWEVVGLCCADKRKADTKIFHVNVYPYRQDCACCGKQLVEPGGLGWCELYDGKAS